jgi:hypothetical protein
MILAHQSDWTGMVLVLVPLGFFAWLLHVANRRATRNGPVPEHPTTPPERPRTEP